MGAVISWLLGVSTTLLMGLVLAILTGALVPGSRADKAAAVAEVQKETIESLKRTNEVQARSILQLEAGSVATERLISALKAVVAPPQNGGKP